EAHATPPHPARPPLRDVKRAFACVFRL
ncbi:MAG: hypothetical protein RIQ79_1961, partial [Verrucomicrobiota bacterium]